MDCTRGWPSGSVVRPASRVLHLHCPLHRQYGVLPHKIFHRNNLKKKLGCLLLLFFLFFSSWNSIAVTGPRKSNEFACRCLLRIHSPITVKACSLFPRLLASCPLPHGSDAKPEVQRQLAGGDRHSADMMATDHPVSLPRSIFRPSRWSSRWLRTPYDLGLSGCGSIKVYPEARDNPYGSESLDA